MTELVLGWQIFILASMLIARFFSSSAMIALAVFWTFWTLVLLFVEPLILLQLCTIWFPVILLAERKRTPPIAVKSTASTAQTKAEPTQNKLASKLNNGRDQASPAPLKVDIASPSINAEPSQPKLVSKPNFLRELAKGADRLNRAATTFRDRSLAHLEFERPFKLQRIVLVSNLKTAARLSEIEKTLDNDPGLRKKFDEVKAGWPGAKEVAEEKTAALPRIPRTIDWPTDPAERAWISERLQDHHLELQRATKQIDSDRYLKAAVTKTFGDDFIRWLEEEATTIRSILGHSKAADPNQHGAKPLDKTQPRAGNVMFRNSPPGIVSGSPGSGPPGAVQTPLPQKSVIQITNPIGPEDPTAAAIRHISEARAIPHLVHFTRADNLPNILRHGLLSRAESVVHGVEQPRNDNLRLDRRLDHISTSIAFPNFSMFYKYRCDEATGDWIVVLLKKEILWKLDCLFTPHNAADARIIGLKETELSNDIALERLFTSTGRSELLRPCDPTDPQAEVMVKSRIGPEWIEALAFETNEALRRHSRDVSRQDVFSCGHGSGLFASRLTMLKNLR